MYLFWKLMSDDSNTCTPCVFFFSFFLVLLIFNHLVSCLLACLVISIENWLLSVKNCSWPYMIYPWLEKAPEKAMAPHSSTLAWKIPWMEEPGKLQSMWSLRVRHDWTTSLSLFTFMHWRRKWNFSVLAWRIPGTGEPGGLPSIGSHRVRHDWSNLAAAAEKAHFIC